jgi:NADH-quinone oxidoreductase subunit A
MLDTTALLGFLLVAVAIVGTLSVGAALLRVRARSGTRLKEQTYECGEAADHPTWVRFHARYYLVALFFVLFDVEAAFLLPWSTAVRTLGPTGLVAIFSFVAVLMVGWFWGLRKGALQWP